MKAAVLREYHRPLELVERPVPELSHPNDVLVRIGGAGVCATDLHAIEGLMEPAGVTLPRVLGHENAGWVEQAGAGVTTVAVGDAVLVYPPYSCGLCVACRRGNDMHCVRHQFTGLSVDGGFASTCSSRSARSCGFPRESSLLRSRRTPTPGSPPTTRFDRVARLAVPGSTAAVIGVGGVGHIALQLVRELGSSTVIAVDTDERRRRLAAELGADEVVDGLDRSRGDERPWPGLVLGLRRAPTRRLSGRPPCWPARRPVCSGRVRRASRCRWELVAVDERSVVGNLVGAWVNLYELLPRHRRRQDHAEDGGAPARLRERGAREAGRRRGDGARSARPGLTVTSVASSSTAARASGVVLLTLAAGQFVMALDTTVMNTAIATVASDVGTNVTGIRTAITLYTLVMASFMITGGKVGEILGRGRAFTIGRVIYVVGSLTTALARLDGA